MAVYTAIPTGNELPWTDVAINTQMSSNNGYNVLVNSILTLPAAPAKGDIIRIFLESGTGFTIAQNGPPVTGQFIIAPGGTTTPGTGGSIVANTPGTALELVCIEPITTWGLFSQQVDVTIN